MKKKDVVEEEKEQQREQKKNPKDKENREEEQFGIYRRDKEHEEMINEKKKLFLQVNQQMFDILQQKDYLKQNTRMNTIYV